MDEDLSGSPSNQTICPAKDKHCLQSGLVKTHNYTTPTPQSIYEDNKLLRSKLGQLKLEDKENNANATTTEEEEEEDEGKGFDEDADDKLDVKLQKRLQQEYELKRHKHHENNNINNNDDSVNSKDNSKDAQSSLSQSSPFDFDDDDDDEPLTPPENFALVIGSIYRSSFPQPANFPFLKTLGLKSVLCLIPEDYPILQEQFLANQNIKLFQLGMSGNKEPFVKISSELITQAIKIVLDPENQPILIHCNRGKHRTGCLVGVLRRLQNWSKTIIFDEYRKFAAPKERPMDQQFIELYDDREITKYCNERGLLPLKWG
ncbi:uncharacterized protein LODBEIA_P14740 [Lodderomyces beijingensis]|uniref:diphosphoinositol-polyphosphate diphosphatase n=1 Tax=Lodderomyces beijingensis TaxID=1775926 RepID=A0ABP0ZJ73_9ASCO